MYPFPPKVYANCIFPMVGIVPMMLIVILFFESSTSIILLHTNKVNEIITIFEPTEG